MSRLEAQKKSGSSGALEREKASGTKAKWFVILHLLLLFYSTCGVMAKLASRQEFLSFKFILLYGCELAILVIYTLFWQQILKHIPLTVAFCNKSVCSVWTMLWGLLFFHESITWNMLLGAAVVICGVLIVVRSDE